MARAALVAAMLAVLAACSTVPDRGGQEPDEVSIATPPDAELGRGKASWYGQRFHGRRTASGERFDMNALTAAHRTLPFGTLVRVINTRNGRAVTVRINDRGPRIRSRIIDVSHAAAAALGLLQAGEAPVVLLRPGADLATLPH